MGEQDLRAFIDALVQWTRTSIDSGRFSKEEASDLRMHAVVLKGMTALILEQGSERDQAAERLYRLMAAAVFLGSRVMTSESAVTFLRAEQTAVGRSKAAEKREPHAKRIKHLIAEAEMVCKPGRGHATDVDNYVRNAMKKKFGCDVSEKTISRHRNKMRTP